MKANIANRAVICDELMKQAQQDERVCIVVSDSRGSASLTPFAHAFPDRVIEVGIAEQNLVGISAGLAASGMKPFAASPACFLTMRSIEQIKVDVAYSNTDVTLVGISAGVSYGALGMSHHSLQDIAVLNAIPNMQIIVPGDRFETKKMMEALATQHGPTYIRVGRNAVSDIHEDEQFNFEIGKALTLRSGDDIAIFTYGDMCSVATDASDALAKQGIQARVINMHTLKPLDEASILQAAKECKAILTLEEHSIYGGLGSMVAQVCGQQQPTKLKIMGIPDEVCVAGSAKEIFQHYGLTKEQVAAEAVTLLK